MNSTAQSVGGAVGLALLATIAVRHATRAVVHGASFGTAATTGAALAFRIGAVIAFAGGVMVAVIRFGAPQSPGSEPVWAGESETDGPQIAPEPESSLICSQA